MFVAAMLDLFAHAVNHFELHFKIRQVLYEQSE